MKIIIAKTYVCAKCEKKISSYWWNKQKEVSTILCKKCINEEKKYGKQRNN